MLGQLHLGPTVVLGQMQQSRTAVLGHLLQEKAGVLGHLLQEKAGVLGLLQITSRCAGSIESLAVLKLQKKHMANASLIKIHVRTYGYSGCIAFSILQDFYC
jgi:hypothetical protein